jgi:hypothetical protein
VRTEAAEEKLEEVRYVHLPNPEAYDREKFENKNIPDGLNC